MYHSPVRTGESMKNVLFCVLLALASCVLSLGQTYKVLWSFGSIPNDGASPVAGLVGDTAGNLYGTTRLGGPGNPQLSDNFGTVFELSPNGEGGWSETILYSFCTSGTTCPDGAYPSARLLIDSFGNLYGTTQGGDNSLACNDGWAGCGTAFELSPPPIPAGSWTETVLYSFCSAGGKSCLDGYEPLGGLSADALGNLYGTTEHGGSGGGGFGVGDNGIVFELSPGSDAWTETVLYSFCPKVKGSRFCPDGAWPLAGVTLDQSGNLYGTASAGGALNSNGGGTIYKLTHGTSGWTQTVLFAMHSPFSAGGAPDGTVALDSRGNIYTTTSLGGLDGVGSILALAPGGKGTAFFFNGTQGASPTAGPLLDGKRRLIYGTASSGGSNDGGTVFEITSGGQLTVLYNFCSQTDCMDGAGSLGNLFEDPSGNLYGTTKFGGTTNTGVVFELTT